MRQAILGVLLGSAMLGVMATGLAIAQDCNATITADEALRAEDARYAAQTSNDFAAMDKLFSKDLIYMHSSGAVDGKASYIDSMRAGRARYRTMKRSDVTVRTYGCLAIINGNAELGVTSGGQDRTVNLRFHSIWAKGPDGLQFVSWQSTTMPVKQ
jgi:ketosteroid isomerase-like protein